MSSIINRAYEGISSSYLATKLYEHGSQITNTVTTLGLSGINLGAVAVGDSVAALTGGYVQLNNLFPLSLRNQIYNATEGIGNLTDASAAFISANTGIDENFVGDVITAPIVEELAFRLPLLVTSSGVDYIASEFFSSSVLEDATGVSGAQVTKVALAALVSIAFTYFHNSNPPPGRASGIFASSMALSYQTLNNQSWYVAGLGNSIVSHMIHNLSIR